MFQTIRKQSATLAVGSMNTETEKWLATYAVPVTMTDELYLVELNRPANMMSGPFENGYCFDLADTDGRFLYLEQDPDARQTVLTVMSRL